MASMDELHAALQKADAAGDTAGAKQIADYIRAQPAAEPAVAPAATISAKDKAMGRVATPVDPKTPIGEAVSKASTSVVSGAIFGAATPEILGGLSLAAAGGAALFPPAAPFLAPAAIALRGASLAATGARTMAAIVGAASGLVSSVAGSATKYAGGGEAAQTVAELAGGFAPGAVGAMVPKATKLAWALAEKVIPGVDATGKKAVQIAEKNIRATIDQHGVPEHDAYINLKKGMEANQKAAQDLQGKTMAEAHAKAAKLVATSPQDAERIMKEAKAQGDKIVSQANAQANALDKASGGKLQTATRVKAMAQPELDKVGQAKPISTIGDEIRGAIDPVQQKILAERSLTYKAADDVVMAKSAAKEAQGVFPETMPMYRQMQADLEKKLLSTEAGRAASKGREVIGDESVRNAYTKIQDVLKTRQMASNTLDAQGNPVMQSFKTTTEALRHLDRRLGEAAFGGNTDPTGFAALGANLAKEEQKKVRAILGEYIGPEYQAMQTKYADASHELGKFGTKSGKAATAMSRVDPKSFLTDAANVPKQYFQTRTGVRDLIELTGGNKEVVFKAAESFAHHEMDGMSSIQAKNWIAKANDWLPEVPGLKQKVMQYATQLGRIEGTATKLESSAGKRVVASKDVRAEGQKQASLETEFGRKRQEELIGQKVESGKTIVADAEKASGAQYAENVKKAQIVAKDGFPQEEMRKLLMTGERSQLEQATKILAGTPGGKDAILGTVRNALSRLGPKELEKAWNGRLSVLFKDGQLIPKAELAKLESDVQAIFKAHEGPEAKRLVQRLIEQAVPAVGAVATNKLLNR